MQAWANRSGLKSECTKADRLRAGHGVSGHRVCLHTRLRRLEVSQRWLGGHAMGVEG